MYHFFGVTLYFHSVFIDISNETLCNTLILWDYFDYSSFDYSSILITDFYDTHAVLFSFKFLMRISPNEDVALKPLRALICRWRRLNSLLVRVITPYCFSPCINYPIFIS